MHGVNLRTVIPLLGPTARAMRWRPFLAAVALGLAVTAVPAATSVLLSNENLVNLLRIAAVCGALGATFLLDDPAAGSIATVPAGRLLRYAVRLVIALAAVAAWWTTVVAITVAGAEHEVSLQLGGTTVEAATLMAVGLGLAVLAGRNAPDGNGSTVAGATLLAVTAGAAFLPEGLALFLAPDDPRWPAAHVYWTLALTAASLVTVVAGYEPVRSRLLRR
ncbi:ABC transporter [Paractinoplanes rishiriensis]|uniref:ABC transporter n=1 Tax=Paractinoplanes rishiriensis TaxID=1050105 RepID=A0A919K4B9_9ACTN|nr:ABC transporter [Actinoplanes rishiriensis]